MAGLYAITGSSSSSTEIRTPAKERTKTSFQVNHGNCLGWSKKVVKIPGLSGRRHRVGLSALAGLSEGNPIMEVPNKVSAESPEGLEKSAEGRAVGGGATRSSFRRRRTKPSRNTVTFCPCTAVCVPQTIRPNHRKTCGCDDYPTVRIVVSLKSVQGT